MHMEIQAGAEQCRLRRLFELNNRLVLCSEGARETEMVYLSLPGEVGASFSFKVVKGYQPKS